MGCAHVKVGTPEVVMQQSSKVDTKDFVEPTSFSVLIERHSNLSLGAVMKVERNGLLICVVKDNGAVAKWNTENPSLDIRPGDKIVGVNGIRGSPAEMTNMLGLLGTSDCEIMRTGTSEVIVRETQQGSEKVLASTPTDNCCDFPHLHQVATMPDDDSVCAICMEAPNEDPENRLVQLPCKHVFHVSCILQWFQKGSHCRCPLCNQSLQNRVVVKLSAIQ
mmetsp:Transcript_113006/g.176588  ORF Transcript_113006/g.176588 Transcript_113006/m.176588 type:complete len:220 (+) Transcript_113006:20-679(+)